MQSSNEQRRAFKKCMRGACSRDRAPKTWLGLKPRDFVPRCRAEGTRRRASLLPLLFFDRNAALSPILLILDAAGLVVLIIQVPRMRLADGENAMNRCESDVGHSNKKSCGSTKGARRPGSSTDC